MTLLLKKIHCQHAAAVIPFFIAHYFGTSNATSSPDHINASIGRGTAAGTCFKWKVR
jgi:hypothetical protein